MSERIPGFGLIGAIARIVPESGRRSWEDEWRGELSYDFERRVGSGAARWWVGFTLRARCLGALRDAWWLRREHGNRSMLGSDVRMAVRNLRRRPGFAAAVVLTLGLGMGGTTAIFSVIDPLMLRPPPYPQVHRSAEIHTESTPGRSYPGVDPEVWRVLREATVPSVFERFEAGAPRIAVVTGAGEPAEVRTHAFTPGALTLLGARPRLGRLFTEADAAPGAPEVVLLGESFWRGKLGSDRDVLGSTLELDGRVFTVIGVLPESFKYPLGTVSMWLPLRLNDPIWPVRGFEAVVRLREGMSLEAAQAAIDGLGTRLAGGQPRPRLWRLFVKPLDRTLAKGLDHALVLLAAAVACVLLIACVNAANLLLVRSRGRQTELAVRRSLGATTERLFRQLVTESLLLALIGGALGVVLAFGGVRAIVSLLPELLVRNTQATIGLDARVLGFGLVLSLITGVVFGAGPALAAARRAQLAGASQRSMTASAAARRAGAALVVAELALSMMLLVGAGLLAKSFVRLLAIDPGFQPRGLHVLHLNLPLHRYGDGARAEAFYAALKERLLALPGVRGVSISDGVPPAPTGMHSGLLLETEGGERRSVGDRWLPYVAVDRDYFNVLGIPMVAGRSFGAEDTPSSPRAVIIDPDLAALLWPNQSALGQRFRIEPGEPWLTVVGIAGNVKLTGPDDRTRPYELYYPASQQPPWRYRAVAVRADAEAGKLAHDIRTTVRALDADQPILGILSAESLFGEALDRQRFLLILMGAFTTVAVVLAAIGLYGVISFLVAQRTREIGLRIALGATPRSMIGAVLGEGAALAALGAAIGAAGALVATRFLTSMLYGVDATDAGTLALVGAVLGAVAAGATLVPAVRAGRVSPLQALRVE